MRSERTEFRDKMLSYILSMPNGKILPLAEESSTRLKQTQSIKDIIDGNFDRLNGVEITFDENYSKIAIWKLKK